MTKILFVCLGNICRSPMAEFVMKHLVKHRADIYIESAATSPYEIGSPVHSGTRTVLKEKLGISTDGKRARQLTADDYHSFDLIICMDNSNLRDLKRIFNNDPQKEKLGISTDGKRARQLTADDYHSFDLIICMDNSNLRDLKRIFNNDPQNKIHLLLEYVGRTDEIADPYYTGNFEKTYEDVVAGCTALLEQLGG